MSSRLHPSELRNRLSPLLEPFIHMLRRALHIFLNHKNTLNIIHVCLLTLASGNLSSPLFPSRLPFFPVSTNSAKALTYSTTISNPLIPSSLPRSFFPSSPSFFRTSKTSATRGISLKVECAAPFNTSSSFQPDRRAHSSSQRQYGSALEASDTNWRIGLEMVVLGFSIEPNMRPSTLIPPLMRVSFSAASAIVPPPSEWPNATTSVVLIWILADDGD